MSPKRQPPSLQDLAQQTLCQAVGEAAEGLVCTPGDPCHTALFDAIRKSISAASAKLANLVCKCVLQSTDRALVVDVAAEATNAVMLAMPPSRIEGMASFVGLSPTDMVSDFSMLAAMVAPVDDDVAQALLFVAHSVLSSNLTEIDTLSLSAASTAAVASQIHKMEDIELLRLTSNIGPTLTRSAMYPLARALHSFSRLRVLQLAQSASDNILRVLSQTCPGTLEEIDVSSSRAVTDKGVVAMLTCPNLSILKLTETSVTANGAGMALRGLSGLRGLGRIPRMDLAVAMAVEQTENEKEFRQELPLRSFKSDRPPSLRVLAEHCPLLREVTICMPEGDCHWTVPHLSGLVHSVPSLNRLSISCEQACSTNDLVGELMNWKDGFPRVIPGPFDSLTCLKLRGTIIGVEEVAAISLACLQLQKLMLCASGPSHRCPQPQADIRVELLSLRVFFAEDLFPDAEIYILSRSPVLEEVTLSHYKTITKQMSITDNALLELLHENPMLNLRTFSVDEAPNLGVKAAERLVMCPNLQVLGYLHTWGRLDGEHLKRLQAFLEEENLDLCLSGLEMTNN